MSSGTGAAPKWRLRPSTPDPDPDPKTYRVPEPNIKNLNFRPPSYPIDGIGYLQLAKNVDEDPAVEHRLAVDGRDEVGNLLEAQPVDLLHDL